jgi:hypothetical protein
LEQHVLRCIAVEMIAAAVWFADLRGFTLLSKQ